MSFKKCWFLKKEKQRIILRKTSRSKDENPGIVFWPQWWRQIFGLINGVCMVNWPPDEIKKLTFSALPLVRVYQRELVVGCLFSVCLVVFFYTVHGAKLLVGGECPQHCAIHAPLSSQSTKSRPNRCNKSMSYFRWQWAKFIRYLRPRLVKNDLRLFQTSIWLKACLRVIPQKSWPYFTQDS